MPKQIETTITESLSFLKKSYIKETRRLVKDRIKTLLYVKENSLRYQSSIAKKLGRNEKTIRDWLALYSTKGYSELVKVKSGGNNTRTISDKVVKLIEFHVTNSETTITSYIELQHILEESTGEKIAYTALYSHCRQKYKTKLKVSRKSHYKKDPNAIAFFKNTRRTV